MKTEKRLSDVTRETSTNRVNKFADSLMPSAPRPKVETPKQEPEPAQEPVQEVSAVPTAPAVASPVQPVSAAAPKAERVRKSAGLSVDEIINMPVKEGEVFNKMVRVTDDQHELLRLMAFKSRKPMNVIVHNLIALLEQAYQKEQKGGQTDV